MKSLGGNATKNAQVQCHESYNTHESALANKGQYRPPVSTLVFNLSLRGIELYFLPQVNSEIGQDRQTPEVLAKLKTSQGVETQKNSEVGFEEDVLTKVNTRCQLVVERRTKSVHVFVTFDLLFS